jgi:putative FmdB family regulatory protein
MPRYAFDCQTDGCHLRFERTLKLGEHPTHVCPGCGAEAPRFFEQEGFAFAFEQPSAAAPGNTGVHKDDYPTADHAVGKDADLRWGNYAEQEKLKRRAREETGAQVLSRYQGKDFVTYLPMTQEGVSTRKGLIQRAKKAMANARGR